jgi:hypothetical protein
MVYAEPIVAERKENALTIMVRHDMPLLHIREAIAHEAHHFWFRRVYGAKYRFAEHPDMWEDAASSFAVTTLWETGPGDNPDNILLT